MGDITVNARFTFPGGSGPGEPAPGLMLSEIDFKLTQQDRVTLVDTIIWDGTENPTDEMAQVGIYTRKYVDADLDLYNYFLTAHYTGVTVLDQNWVNGALGIEMLPLGTKKKWPYDVLTAGDVPIDGVKVEIHRNGSGGTNVIWVGYTNLAGAAKDQYDLDPRLDPGFWEFWRFHALYDFVNPDIEEVI